MKFNFEAKSQTGEYKKGTIDASSKEIAVSILQKNNLVVTSLKSQKEDADIAKNISKYFDKVSNKELVVFFRQLSILIEARVPIVFSLKTIQEQTANVYFANVIKEIVTEIEDGMSFSSATEKHQDIFSNFSVYILRAGEASGNLKKSIDYITKNLERNYELSSRIKSALIYPMIVMIVFFIIGFLLVSFIIPKLTLIIKELSANVPWYTQLVINLGDFMSKYWWIVGIFIIGFVGLILYYLKTKDGKREWDHIKIKIPIVGVIYRYVYITRLAENLAVLLEGGIPIIRALAIVGDLVDNDVYKDILLKASKEIKKGGNMSIIFQREEIIPPMVSRMIAIGEESGQIDSVLKHIAKFYDQETEIMARNLASLLEPVLMVVIGVSVGFIAFSILMPIYNIAGQIK